MWFSHTSRESLGGRENHATAKKATTREGTGVGSFNPPKSAHSVPDPSWSAAGLHKSLSPLTRQDTQPGAQRSSLTIHTELVWPMKHWDRISACPCHGKAETWWWLGVWGLLGIFFFFFYLVSSRRNVGFQQTQWKEGWAPIKVGLCPDFLSSLLGRTGYSPPG